MGKVKRPRVSREQVRDNAAKSDRLIQLPDNVREWFPEKPGTYLIDILPYEVKSATHPDRVEPGVVWYKYPWLVHRNVGVESRAYVCPTTVGRSCPVCQEKAMLAKNYDVNKEQIDAIKARKMVSYNIVDPDDSDRVAVFSFGRGKFAEFLENELKEASDDDLTFFDVTADGRTLKVRFSEDVFNGQKFIKATRIDFVKREPMPEDDVLAATVCLDTIFVVPTYEELKKAFLQLDDSEGASSPAADRAEEPAPKSGGGRFGARKPAPVVEEEPEEEPEPEEQPEETPEPEPEEEPEPPPARKPARSIAPKSRR